MADEKEGEGRRRRKRGGKKEEGREGLRTARRAHLTCEHSEQQGASAARQREGRGRALYNLFLCLTCKETLRIQKLKRGDMIHTP